MDRNKHSKVCTLKKATTRQSAGNKGRLLAPQNWTNIEGSTTLILEQCTVFGVCVCDLHIDLSFLGLLMFVYISTLKFEVNFMR